MSPVPRLLSIIVVLTATLLLTITAPRATPNEQGLLLPSWLRLEGEYRVESNIINPMELSGTDARSVHWTEQRLRLDLGLVKMPFGAVVIQMDILDGVLFGDNGQWGGAVSPTSGLSLSSHRPNQAGWEIGLADNRDPLDPDSYLPVLRPVSTLELNLAFGEVFLPVGLLRIGRQPVAYGGGIMGHEGTRINRWGISRYSHIADRILFGTKLDQLFVLLSQGLDATFDTSTDRGLFLAMAYDWATQDDIYHSSDNLHQLSIGLQAKLPNLETKLMRIKNLQLSAFVVRRFNEEFQSSVTTLPFSLSGQIGEEIILGMEFQYAMVFGETREVSEGFALLMESEGGTQKISARGAHARLDLELGKVTLSLEFDYASGDDDPRSETDLTTFNFNRDFNVGLLLFEHILAFESARSAAVGIRNLSELEANSFPLTETATDGRFTNAIALFPQIKLDLLKSEKNKLHIRLGALIAWPAAQGGAIDSIMTALRTDGTRVDDDRVNFHGGPPGDYYGTELDLQIKWIYGNFFDWTLEGALLFPGNSLRDEHGDGVNTFLITNRFTFIF